MESPINLAYIPAPSLSEFVEIFWFYHGSAPAHDRERVLPTGTVELIINLRDDVLRAFDRDGPSACQQFRGALVCGPHSQFFVIDATQQERILGVHFKPGGAWPFLALPASDLHDTLVSLDALWGAAAIELREQLLAAPTPQAMFHILEQQLLARMTRSLTRHPAVAYAVRASHYLPQARSIAELAEHAGFGARRLAQVFCDEVGMPPKRFFRVQRFQAVLRQIEQGQPLAWADVALACGYYDQAHFVHDFRAFSGLNPSAYLTQHIDHFNHVPL